MTWEMKLYALMALADTSLRMRKPGDWYVSMRGVEIKGDGTLTSASGDGPTPERAVEAHWQQHATGGRVLVLNAMDAEARREVRWNGFMWEDAHAD